MTSKRSAVRTADTVTIFTRMTQLAISTGAVNLGQGFPDTDGPDAVLHHAAQAIRDGVNQYPPGRGRPELREAVAAHRSRWYGVELDPASQVVVTMGATEGIAAAVMAFIRPGDEVVMFEPYYDSYAAMTERVGGVRRTVPLRFPDFTVDRAALAAAFSERTALVILNTPHNPTGKVFTAEELALVAEFAERYDAVVLSDEVYEHLALAPTRHVPAATVRGLAERTVTLGSGGKTFNTTGWKIGWATGPADLIAAVDDVKQFLTFQGGAPLQLGIAAGLDLPVTFFDALRESMRERRDRLVEGLARAGFTVTVPEGGYFVLADAAPLGVSDAEEFALRLPEESGVVAVPASVFCDNPDATGMRAVMRFAFCKKPETIDLAVARLMAAYGR